MKNQVAWIWSLLLIAAAFVTSAVVYDRLPEQVPIHWNIRGEADQFGHKVWAAWLTPGIMVGFAMLMAVLPVVSPQKFRVDSFRRVYDGIVVLVMALFLFIHLVSLRQTFDPATQGGRLLISGMFLFFVLLGNFMGKIRRNFWMGIRVPWTLASDRVWNETHRLAAWFWVAAGIVGAVLASLNQMIAALAILSVAILIPVFYSLWLYKTLERRGELSDSDSVAAG